jgi:hypothetical protein
MLLFQNCELLPKSQVFQDGRSVFWRVTSELRPKPVG